jgi:hypothetical protein
VIKQLYNSLRRSVALSVVLPLNAYNFPSQVPMEINVVSFDLYEQEGIFRGKFDLYE